MNFHPRLTFRPIRAILFPQTPCKGDFYDIDRRDAGDARGAPGRTARSLFEELNGGVCLLEEAKRDPAAREDDLYILGEYCEGPLGRSIVLYYGSFARLFGRLGPLQLRRELRKTVRHEFRHHIEALAGEDALDREDEAQFGDYLRRHAAREDPERARRAALEAGRREGRLFRRRPRK